MFMDVHKLGNVDIPKNQKPHFYNELNNIDWNNVLQTTDLDYSCNIMMKTLTGLIKKYTQMLSAYEEESLHPG